MTIPLKPYPKMKPSGVQWLGEVPEHWEILPNRAVFQEVKDKGYPEEQMLSVTIKRGVIQQTELLNETSKKDSSNIDKSNYKLVQPGDIAYNKMRAWQGAFGISQYRGIVSPAYVIQRPKQPSDSEYFHYLFRTPIFAKESERWSYGITSDMWSLRPEHFKMIYVSHPPHEEQSAIVRYLSYMDKKIRKYIRNKQKLIKLLEEQKQAIIHQAVTGQIDVRTGKPYSAYKDSGVEWLGKVPEEWEVLRLGWVLKERKEKNNPIKTDEILSLSLSKGVIPYAEKTGGGNKAKSDLSAYMLAYPNDIVLNSMNVVVGSVGLSKYFGAVSPVYYVLYPRNEIEDVQFYDSIFQDPSFQKSLFGLGNGIMVIESKSTGKLNTIRMRIPMTRLNKVLIPKPPIGDQTKIIEFVNKEKEEFKTVLDRTAKDIDLLREYRTTLIAAVVTGKLDVREAAQSLPDISELDEPDVEEEVIEEEETVDAEIESNSED